MKANLNEIWDLIKALNPEEKKILFKKMQDDVKQKLEDILEEVNKIAKENPISFDSITEEVESVRGKLYDQN